MQTGEKVPANPSRVGALFHQVSAARAVMAMSGLRTDRDQLAVGVSGEELVDRRHRCLAVWIAALSCAVLIATAVPLPMAWDEGNSIARSRGIARWCDKVLKGIYRGELEILFRRDLIDLEWQYTTAVEGHPALYGIVIAVGSTLSRYHLSPLLSARCGPIVLASLSMGAAFYRLTKQYGVTTGLTSIFAMLTTPRLFAHLHFASFDGPLTSCWILCWALFEPALRSLPYAVAWGIALGLTLSCKSTGWLCLAAYGAWLCVYCSRRAVATVGAGSVLALATFYVVNPRLWHDPLGGFSRFLSLNACRTIDVATIFLGQRYDLHHSLPWYNTIVLTISTSPLPILVAAAIGVLSVARSRRRDTGGLLIVLHWLVLLVVRALPFTPPHDGERLILPSFAFLAILAGIGAARCAARLRMLIRSATLRLVLPAMTAFLVASTLLYNMLCFAPQWLAFYSAAIGAPDGAVRLGMEPTYYWDSLDAEVLSWLHEHSELDEAVRFGPISHESLALMHQWGLLRRPVADERDAYRWYIMQLRPSTMSKLDKDLVKHETPAYVKLTGSPHCRRWGWARPVPLLYIFGYEQVVRAAVRIGSPVTQPSDLDRHMRRVGEEP
jgi:hypothetical protein